MSANINICYLCANVPLDASNTRQLYFASPAEQNAYFLGKALKTNTDYKYIREERALKVPYNAEEIQECNYIAFYNTGLSTPTKWIYGFVDKIQYVNPNVSAVFFTVDAWQTWGMLADIRDCDITREHTESGAPWNANTVPEGLEYGDLECVHEIRHTLGDPDEQSYIILSTVDFESDPGTKEDPVVNAAKGARAGRLPSACAVYYVGPATSTITEIFSAMREFPWVAQGVVSVTYCPRDIIAAYNVVSSPMGFSIGSLDGISMNSIQENVGGVTSFFPAVRNGKLHCSPYCYIELIMPDGSGKRYLPELFTTGSAEFQILAAMIPSPTMQCRLLPYDGTADPVGNGVAYNGFPSFPVPQSGYATTVAQMNASYDLNRAQARQSRIFGAVQSAVSAFEGGATGTGLAAGIVGIFSSYAGAKLSDQQSAQRERMAIAQHTEGTSLSGASSGADNAILANDSYHIAIRFYSIRQEWRNRLDNYFDMYGYKVNRVGRPHITLRPRYNYIKCSSVNIYGAIPSDHLQQIRAMFLNGVTFWQDHENVGTYGNNG